MQLREGESVGDYISRLEKRVKELEPAEGFTVQEWHIGQVFTYLLWRRPEDDADIAAWDSLLSAYERRFPEPVAKFAKYMDWPMRRQQ